MKAPIHSRKHYTQWSRSSVAVTAIGVETIAHGVAVANKNAPSEVEEGALVKAVFLELWVLSTGNDAAEVVTISKTNEDLSAMTYAESIALDTFNNKKNVLFVHQGLSANDGIGNPIVAFRGWVKIPRGKQRFGLGDKLSVTVSNLSPTNTMDYCGFATYKEYT